MFVTLSYMLYEKPENTEINYFLGYIYGIASAFLGTLFTMFNAKYINKVDAAKITMLEMLGGVIVISMYFLIIGDFSVYTTPLITSDIIYLILLGTICTAGIFVWMTEMLDYEVFFHLVFNMLQHW